MHLLYLFVVGFIFLGTMSKFVIKFYFPLIGYMLQIYMYFVNRFYSSQINADP